MNQTGFHFSPDPHGSDLAFVSPRNRNKQPDLTQSFQSYAVPFASARNTPGDPSGNHLPNVKTNILSETIDDMTMHKLMSTPDN